MRNWKPRTKYAIAAWSPNTLQHVICFTSAGGGWWRKSATQYNAAYLVTSQCNATACNAKKTRNAQCNEMQPKCNAKHKKRNAGLRLSAIYLITSPPLPAKAPTVGRGEVGGGWKLQAAYSLTCTTICAQWRLVKKWYSVVCSCTLKGTNMHTCFRFPLHAVHKLYKLYIQSALPRIGYLQCYKIQNMTNFTNKKIQTLWEYRMYKRRGSEKTKIWASNIKSNMHKIQNKHTKLPNT